MELEKGRRIYSNNPKDIKNYTKKFDKIKNEFKETH